jgi:hypothetical protein
MRCTFCTPARTILAAVRPAYSEIHDDARADDALMIAWTVRMGTSGGSSLDAVDITEVAQEG